MRNIVALALLFVLSIADFGQEITIQTEKVKPKAASKTQKVKPKIASKTQKVKPKTTPTPKAETTVKTTVTPKPKTSPKTTVATKPKTSAKTAAAAKAKTKPKVKTKTKETAVKAKTEPKITTLDAITVDGKDVMLKEDGTWAYKKPEPTPKSSPVAKPTAMPAPVAKTTPTPAAKQTLTPAVKPSPVAKTKPAPTPSQCDLTLKDAPLIRGLRLGMSRDEADGIIPLDRVNIINSSDIISYPQFSNASNFKDVYQISARFSEDRLSALDIVYESESQKWKNAKEFAEALSESFKLSPRFWKYNTRNAASAEMQCKEFSIKIDSAENEISLQKINASINTAQEQEAQKKIFKP
jgi:hypothetical protein